MKNYFIILTLLLLFVPVRLFCIDHGLYISETLVKSSNINDVLGDGTVKFISAEDKNTLILNNATINSSIFMNINVGIYYFENKDLELELIGKNVINVNEKEEKLDNYGIFNASNKKLIISGDGSLDIINGDGSSLNVGIFSNIVDISSNVNINVGNGYFSSGIMADNVLINSNLSSKSSACFDYCTASYGIFSNKNLNLTINNTKNTNIIGQTFAFNGKINLNNTDLLVKGYLNIDDEAFYRYQSDGDDIINKLKRIEITVDNPFIELENINTYETKKLSTIIFFISFALIVVIFSIIIKKKYLK